MNRILMNAGALAALLLPLSAQEHVHAEPEVAPQVTVGFFVDALYVGGGEDLLESAETLDIRSAGLEIGGRFEPFGSVYALAVFEDDSAELEEIALSLERLPAGLELRAGRFFADFGRWNRLHLHDKPFAFEDGVREATFGGNLRLDGVQLGQSALLGDLPVRWSLGLGTAFGGHAEGHEDAGAASDGRSGFEQFDIDRSPSNWGYTGRFAARQPLGHDGYLEWGGSFFHTPEGIAAEADTDGFTGPDLFVGLEQTTLALDLTLRLMDDSHEAGNTVSVEAWLTDREVLEEVTGAVLEREAAGLWGYAQHDFDAHWAVGAMAGWWQEPGQSVSADWFSSASAAAMRAAYLTWSLAEGNRLRLQVTQLAPEDAGTAWVVALQWDVILGSHAHPMDS